MKVDRRIDNHDCVEKLKKKVCDVDMEKVLIIDKMSEGVPYAHCRIFRIFKIFKLSAYDREENDKEKKRKEVDTDEIIFTKNVANQERRKDKSKIGHGEENSTYSAGMIFCFDLCLEKNIEVEKK